MDSKASAKRRERVERNIYKRTDGAGKTVYEIGFRDSTGVQRWRVVGRTITAARAARDDVLGRKGRGERIQPNPTLTFGQAADAWLAGQVADLRPATQAIYKNAVETHLRSRWGRRRLDRITIDDVAELMRELRANGKAEWTISGVLKAARRIFTFARRRMNWVGDNPCTRLEEGERPRTGATAKRRLFTSEELVQTIAAAREPWKTLFAFASVTGARLSECLGLVWDNLALDDLDTASATFEYQVDRKGIRRPLKTEESRRTVELPRGLGAILAHHKLASAHSSADAFVFASRSGRPLMQRNVVRALRLAQTKAADEYGRPIFPALHVVDERGRPVPVPRGSIPSFHCFRHTAASEAIAAGESVEEVAWQLGHRNSTVTRAVYVQEVKNAERTARRRARMETQYKDLLENTAPQT